jgi:hypothetical protein
MVAGFAPALGEQARGTVLLEAAQQTADQLAGVSNTQTTRLNPTCNSTSRRLNSRLLIDTTAKAHLPGPQNAGECHLYFAKGCHLYIALTGFLAHTTHYDQSAPFQRGNSRGRFLLNAATATIH